MTAMVIQRHPIQKSFTNFLRIPCGRITDTRQHSSLMKEANRIQIIDSLAEWKWLAESDSSSWKIPNGDLSEPLYSSSWNDASHGGLIDHNDQWVVYEALRDNKRTASRSGVDNSDM